MASQYEDEEDDDEWAVEPVGFEQDPENDSFGVGTWHYPDGTTKYGPGQEKAGKLVASGWGYDEKGVLRPPTELDKTQPTEEPAVEETVVEEPVAAAPAPVVEPEPTALPPQPSAAQQAAQKAGLRAGGFQQRNEESSSRTVSGALPEQMAREQSERLAKAGDEYTQAIDDQRFREAARKAERAGQAIEAGKLKELEGASEKKAHLDRTTRAQAKAKEVSAKEVNPRRAWQEAGAFNKVLGSIAVFLGGVSAYMRGGQNSALQNIKDTLEADTKAQMENKDSEVAYWTRELGDARAGMAAADLKKWQGVQQQLEGNLLDEQSVEVLERGSVLMKQVKLEIANKTNELEKLNYGNEVKSEQAAKSEQASFAAPAPRAAGPTADEQEMKQLKLDQMREQQGYTPEQRAAALVRSGFIPPGGKTAAEWVREKDAAAAAGNGKYTEVEGKAISSRDTINAFGEKAGLRRNPQSGKWEVSDDGIVPPGWVESVNPFDDDEVEAAGEAAVEAFGRLESGGVIGEDEEERFRRMIGMDTGNRRKLAAKLNAAEVIVEGKLPVGERGKGRAAPAEWKKKDE